MAAGSEHSVDFGKRLVVQMFDNEKTADGVIQTLKDADFPPESIEKIPLEGLELHQTRWPTAQWRAYLEKEFPDLEYVDVGLKIYQFVRYNFLHTSFLLLRKKKG